jgi:hypothetical protein
VTDKAVQTVEIKTAIRIGWRYFAYAAALALVNQGVKLLAKDAPRIFQEGHFVEAMQFSLLLVTVLIFSLATLRLPHNRELLLLLAGITALAACRELDSFLGRHLPVISWRIGFLPLLAAAVYFCRAGRRAWGQAGELARSQAFVVLWAGLLIAYPIAQLTGHGEFLRGLMQEDYSRTYKRAIEETLELMGYLVLCFGAIETVLGMRRNGVAQTVDGVAAKP